MTLSNLPPFNTEPNVISDGPTNKLLMYTSIVLTLKKEEKNGNFCLSHISINELYLIHSTEINCHYFIEKFPMYLRFVLVYIFT